MSSRLFQPYGKQIARYLHLFGGIRQFETAFQMTASGHPLFYSPFHSLHGFGRCRLFLVFCLFLFILFGLHDPGGGGTDGIDTETINEIEDAGEKDGTEECQKPAVTEDNGWCEEGNQCQDGNGVLHPGELTFRVAVVVVGQRLAGMTQLTDVQRGIEKLHGGIEGACPNFCPE